MDAEQNVAPVTSKKKHEKTDSPTDHTTVTDTKKDRKSDVEDPKPRIVLTFRSEKPGAKSSNMKIVSTEEKHEAKSPRRSSRTRGAKWDSDDDNEALVSPKKDKHNQSVSETDDVSDSSHTTPKRSTRRRSKEFDNVIANAIARKEKSYNETPVPTRLSRRIKPTAKVLANEELRIGLESQNNARLRIQTEKSPEEGVRTRRSLRASRQNVEDSGLAESTEVEKPSKEDEGDSQNQVLKLKHLCELGLKAITPEAGDKKDQDVLEESEAIEIEDDGDDEEIDDETEVINKLLEADDDSDTDDMDYCCEEEASRSEPLRRSSRLCSSFGVNTSDRSSPVLNDDDQSLPLRRSGRMKRRQWQSESSGDDASSTFKSRKKSRSARSNDAQEESHSGGEQEASTAAGGSEGSEAAGPAEASAVVAACHCQAPSNVHAAPGELTEPVFCQAIELIDGTRVGCSHGARRSASGSLGALVRCGPRTPFILLCPLHAEQLERHMCCPACGMFCTQGTFYQCSLGHLFHVECGLPYAEARPKPGCPHCGLRTSSWLPANRDCARVRLRMRCSNKTVFLPDQREQCTPAYLGFSTLKPCPEGPLVPEDLLPAPPIDLKSLCKSSEPTTAEALCDAILAGETTEQLLPKIMSGVKLDAPLSRAGGGTCSHLAARRGNLRALYLLQFAGVDLNAIDSSGRTPLMLAVLALDKSENKSPKKPSKAKDSKEESEEMGDHSEKEDSNIDEKEGEKEKERPSDEDLLKVIRYLVAAGVDVNLPGPDGMTALHMAASLEGGEEACEALLAAAHVDPRDAGGWTPLVWAAENGRARTVRLLLSHGADASATDDEGNAAVHWCALAGQAHALQMLLDADHHALQAANGHSDTPLHVAARHGHYACVVVLLARGARTDVENSAGELPVEVCSGQCQRAVSLNMQMALAAGRGPTNTFRLLSSDISNGREDQPIPCVNEVDDEPLPTDFTYVTTHVTPRSLLLDNSTHTMQGCTCVDSECSSVSCACCVLGVRRWTAKGRLLPDFPYHDPPMLFECNQTCGCNAKKCTNNMVTRALRLGSVCVRAVVFRAGGARGWGLRAAQPVSRGQLVAAYCGELLPAGDADSRAHDHYMFALDLKPDLLEQCSEKSLLCVDAARWGGAARFINHSCSPNLACVRVFTHSRDLRLPTIAMFATKPVRVGEEFTFDYGDKFWSVKSKWMKCECGESECRYPVKATDDAES